MQQYNDTKKQTTITMMNLKLMDFANIDQIREIRET